MPANRSRQGCDECRRRRRKCDEKKPTCGPCFDYNRVCNYTLNLVWGGRSFSKSRFGTCLQAQNPSATKIYNDGGDFIYGTNDLARDYASLPHTQLPVIPQSLPNGMPMPPRYRKLLDYLAKDVLASLSCHPSIHEDLCRGLVPAMLHSPHLLSAGLALSAAGFLSRGLVMIDGTDVSRIIVHLQSSGLSLLRAALERGQMDEVSLSTCIIWCLADVFSTRQGVSSWRIHLEGVRAILGSNKEFQDILAKPGPTQSALKHLYQLYLSLQTLPHVPSLPQVETLTETVAAEISSEPEMTSHPKIDGFLGYSEELLGVLQRIAQLTNQGQNNEDSIRLEADILLGRVKSLIARDMSAPPSVSISSDLSTESGRDFALCNKIFQQATLIHLYRRLYNLPSGSAPIQGALTEMIELINSMTQGQPCHTWVAMAMPLFTMGCEAFSDEQKEFVLDKIHKFEVCLGSLHVRVLRQALEDIWKLRLDQGDVDGTLCAGLFL
ncbi:unnamed protein product, partial [Clonostachys rhizophaga]